MQGKKKEGYFEFDPLIYPRKLWVYVGKGLNGLIDKCFDGIEPQKDEDYYCLTYVRARRKTDGKIGVLVAFLSKNCMDMNNIVHESSHAVDAIEEAIGMTHGGEPSAYLMEWVAECIKKARNGQGDFVETAE